MKKIEITITGEDGLWQTQRSMVSDTLATDICIAAKTGKTHFCHIRYTSRLMRNLINDHPKNKLTNTHLLKTLRNKRY